MGVLQSFRKTCRTGYRCNYEDGNFRIIKNSDNKYRNNNNNNNDNN